MNRLGTYIATLSDCETGKKRKFQLVLTPDSMMEILAMISVPELHQKSAECDIPTFALLAEIMCEDEKAKMSVYATAPNETIAMLIELATFIISGGNPEKKPLEDQKGVASP